MTMRCTVLVPRAPIVWASRHAAVVALPPQIHVALREDVVLEPARAVARLPAAIPLTLGALGNTVGALEIGKNLVDWLGRDRLPVPSRGVIVPVDPVHEVFVLAKGRLGSPLGLGEELDEILATFVASRMLGIRLLCALGGLRGALGPELRIRRRTIIKK